MTEPTAYERLQQAAAKANEGAHLLAMNTLRDVHRECAALEDVWADQQCDGADHVRMVLARIRAKLAPATGAPETVEQHAERLVRHLFPDDKPSPAPEHCVHSAAIHQQHHTSPVPGCPWCTGGTTTVNTGGLT